MIQFCWWIFKRAGGVESALLDIFCYISAGCYLFALKLHDFFFLSLALNLRPFKKIEPRVMTRRCVIERWVQRKTDKNWCSMEITHKSCFCFQDTLSLCLILSICFIWSKNMCKHTLTHIVAKKCNFCLKKAKNNDFGDFWWFSCFYMTSLMMSLWRHARYFCTFLVPMDSEGS